MGEILPFAAEARKVAIQAYGMSIATDETGCVWIRLHDKAGEIYATACVREDTARQLAAQAHQAAEISASLAGGCATAVH